MTFFELCFGMEGKHVVILGCGLVSGISVSVRVVARIDVLHLIQQSEVVANDVLILCWEYELWFVLETPSSVTECGS